MWIDSADFLTLTGLKGADPSWFHYRSGGKRNASVIWHTTVFVRCWSREQKSSSCFLESACHTGLSASSESQLCLPLFLFLSWFREKCSHTILRKSAKKPLCQSQSGAPSSREVIIDAVFAFATTRKAHGRPRSMHCALGCRFPRTRVTHHPSMSIPTVFLRTNSLPSTASLTLPSPSLPPPLHLPSARHSDRSDACPLSVAQIAL